MSGRWHIRPLLTETALIDSQYNFFYFSQKTAEIYISQLLNERAASVLLSGPLLTSHVQRSII